MKKQETLRRIHDEWEKLLSALSVYDEEQKLRPRVVGEWSLKDLMSHISAWESVALERLGRVKRGEEVEFIPDDQIDEWNRQRVQQRREWKLIVVEGEFENVHARLVQEFERLQDEWWDRNVSKVCEWIPECTFVHYAEHRSRLESLLIRTQHGVSS